jgi:hypothetical protein
VAEGKISATEGAGKNVHTFDRTIASVLVQDQFVLPGEFPYPSYFVHAQGVSGANSGDDLMQVMAGSANYVRVRRIEISQRVPITTAQEFTVDVTRLTTAGTGGVAVTPARFDNGDPAAGASAASTVPNATHGTAGTILRSLRIWGLQTPPTAGVGGGLSAKWEQHRGTKPIIIPAGASNGISLRVQTGRAGITLDVEIEIVETPWLGG